MGVETRDYTERQCVDSIRLVIDEAVGLVLTSSLRKNTIEYTDGEDGEEFEIHFDLSNLRSEDRAKVYRMKTSDSFTIEVDTGEVPMEVSAITDTFINALT